MNLNCRAPPPAPPMILFCFKHWLSADSVRTFPQLKAYEKENFSRKRHTRDNKLIVTSTSSKMARIRFFSGVFNTTDKTCATIHEGYRGRLHLQILVTRNNRGSPKYFFLSLTNFLKYLKRKGNETFDISFMLYPHETKFRNLIDFSACKNCRTWQ